MERTELIPRIELPSTTDMIMPQQHLTKEHSHHWRIEEANGQFSEGVCIICGATKQFSNWLADSDYILNSEHRDGSNLEYDLR